MLTATGCTPHDLVLHDGTARLLRFHAPGAERLGGSLPVLLVPSLINRYYVLDLHAGASVVAALCNAGLDTYCLDWGVAEDEDRYLDWDGVVLRLERMMRATLRACHGDRLGLLGYCMGGTLAAIAAARMPRQVAALVNLAGPIDFSHAGLLGKLVDRRWFDAETIAAAGNISPWQMQSGFSAMRPTLQLSKMVRWLDRLGDAAALEHSARLERWVNDNVPFPAAAYRRYIGELYQRNALVRSEHRVAGNPVLLGSIGAPVLTVVAKQDGICPPPCAQALNEAVGSEDARVLELPGGHVGAVVGGRARTMLYPELSRWLADRLARHCHPALPTRQASNTRSTSPP